MPFAGQQASPENVRARFVMIVESYPAFFNFAHTAFGPAVKPSCGDSAYLAASVQLADFLGMLLSREVPPRREFLMRNPAHALPLTIWATPLPQRRGPARPCLAPSDGGKGRAPASTSMAPPNGWNGIVASATSALPTRHQLALTL